MKLLKGEDIYSNYQLTMILFCQNDEYDIYQEHNVSNKMIYKFNSQPPRTIFIFLT